VNSKVFDCGIYWVTNLGPSNIESPRNFPWHTKALGSGVALQPLIWRKNGANRWTKPWQVSRWICAILGMFSIRLKPMIHRIFNIHRYSYRIYDIF
jgi:hypothetical protein